jgi:hypothetical protein
MEDLAEADAGAVVVAGIMVVVGFGPEEVFELFVGFEDGRVFFLGLDVSDSFFFHDLRNQIVSVVYPCFVLVVNGKFIIIFRHFEF